MPGGFRGPVPKRDEDRQRANAPEVPIETLNTDMPAPEFPPLGIPGAHPIAEDWYASLAVSAQSVYYEASDWQSARVCAFMLSNLLHSKRPSSDMYKAIISAFSSLLVTEGDRRRVRIEVARHEQNAAKANEQDKLAVVMETYQAMMAGVA